MSNILSDPFRQIIAKSIVETVKPKTYAECGCYHGASMNYWNQILPPDCQIVGCDNREETIKECKTHVPRAILVNCDSREWLQNDDLPQPIVFYLDTDWTVPAVKDQEIKIILDRWKNVTIVANSVNYEDHKLFGSEWKPFSVAKIFELFGHCCDQFIVPKYKAPILENGYVIIHRGDVKIPFDEHIFGDLKTC